MTVQTLLGSMDLDELHRWMIYHKLESEQLEKDRQELEKSHKTTSTVQDLPEKPQVMDLSKSSLRDASKMWQCLQ